MEDKILTLAMALASNPAASLDQVQKLTEVTLARAAVQSNEYFDVFVSSGQSKRSEIAKVEVRVNKEKRRVRMFIIDVNAKNHCLSEPDIRKKLGSPHDFSVASPRQGGNVPNYYSYAYPWGELRFGIPAAGPECCVSVVVEFKA